VIDLSLGRNRSDLIVMVTRRSSSVTTSSMKGRLSAPIQRDRRHAARRREGVDRHGGEQAIEGKDLRRAPSARNGSSRRRRVHRPLRGIKREMIVQDSEAQEIRQVVRVIFFELRSLRCRRFTRSSARGIRSWLSCRSRIGRRGAGSNCSGRRPNRCANGIPVIQPTKIKDEAFLQQIRDLKPDLGVVVAFGRILPDPLLAIPRLGMINVHASLLPRYRGAAPIQRAVLAGDAETGVTIMRVETEMDAGPTFTAATVPIPPDATSGEMETTLARLGGERLLPVIDDLAAGRAVETHRTIPRRRTPPRLRRQKELDWNEPAGVVHNRVRGLQPWPLASATIGGSAA
jgi:folate-dependent phosphoribosylglycinamide formyltransferase PurN